ncbi:MAG: hypothetical protein LBP41_00155 [Holosporaceae bacterium]|nr:hypothetical protein [Holosporaceae bacterium]
MRFLKKVFFIITSLVAGYYFFSYFKIPENQKTTLNETAASRTTALTPASTVLTKDVLRILDLIEQRGYKAKIFGGAVRNYILGISLEDSDIDIATTMPAEEAADVLGKIANVEKILRHRIKLKYNGKYYDIVVIDKRENPSASSTPIESFEEFSKSRDFTMNAIYMNRDGKLEDYNGGIADIMSGKVRFVCDPLKRISENYRRVFRYFRFVATCGNYNYDQEYISLINSFIQNKGEIKASGIQYFLKEILKTFHKSDSYRAVPAMRFLLEKIFNLDLSRNPLEICFKLGFDDMSPLERVSMLFKFSKIPMEVFIEKYDISAFSEPMVNLLMLKDAIDIEDAKSKLKDMPEECRNFYMKYALLKAYMSGTQESEIKKFVAETKINFSWN